MGLGNPGARYAGTRHNIGFQVVDLLVRRWSAGAAATRAPAELFRARLDREAGPEEILLLKPLTYMNRSGGALAALARERNEPLEAGGVFVITDDLYLPFGRLRLRGQGSAGGHNGLKSVAQVLASTEFPRLRCGVGPQPDGMPAEEFVLDDFSPGEREALPEFVGRAADAVQAYLIDGLEPAMNRFNRT